MMKGKGGNKLKKETKGVMNTSNLTSNLLIEENLEKVDIKEVFDLLGNHSIDIPIAQEMLRAALSGVYTVEKLHTYLTIVSQLEEKKAKQSGFLETKDQTKLNNNKQLLKFQTQVKNFLDLLSKNGFTLDEVAEVLLPFADPTFDTTFKELFGLNKHEDILVSLLNNLLGFKNSETIVSVETIVGNLETGNFSYKKGESGLTSEVDVLCTTKNGKTIAIEMQRAKQTYFLARMEYYMSKLIAGQLTEEDTNNHHKAIDKTYILVLAKENLFTGHHALVDQINKGTQTGKDGDHKSAEVSMEVIKKLDYEIDCKPVIKQTNQEFPDNKMYWKFFELPKFKEHEHSKNLNKDSDLKYQWLEFVIDCGSQLSEPDRHNLIMKGYNIMKTLQRDNLLKAKYWNEYAAQFEHELDIESQKQHAKLEGIKEGKWKGEVKGEIKQMKTFKELESSGVDVSKFYNTIKYKDQIENYFTEHPNYKEETESVIMGGMDIEMD